MSVTGLLVHADRVRPAIRRNVIRDVAPPPEPPGQLGGLVRAWRCGSLIAQTFLPLMTSACAHTCRAIRGHHWPHMPVATGDDLGQAGPGFGSLGAPARCISAHCAALPCSCGSNPLPTCLPRRLVQLRAWQPGTLGCMPQDTYIRQCACAATEGIASDICPREARVSDDEVTAHRPARARPQKVCLQ